MNKYFIIDILNFYISNHSNELIGHGGDLSCLNLFIET